jgi:hypothetical protein
MKRTLVWVVAVVLGAGLLIALPGLFMMGTWGFPFHMTGGMMSGMMGGAMMSSHHAWTSSPVSWIGIVLGWSVQLALVALLVTGIVWFIRKGAFTNPSA